MIMNLCPNEIKTHQKCCLLNSFSSSQRLSEYLRKFLAAFGSVWKIVANLRKSPRRFQ